MAAFDTDRQDGLDETLHAPHVGDGITTPAGSWTFGGEVPEAFDAHVARSVPSYTDGQELIADLADQLVPPGGRVYDLGCSTGALTAQLAERLAPRRAEVIGVDREPGMTERARDALRGAPAGPLRDRLAPGAGVRAGRHDRLLLHAAVRAAALARAEIVAPHPRRAGPRRHLRAVREGARVERAQPGDRRRRLRGLEGAARASTTRRSPPRRAASAACCSRSPPTRTTRCSARPASTT